MTTLAFHLGDRKTGSTAIQHGLSLSRWVCDSVMLLYPQAHWFNHIACVRPHGDRFASSFAERAKKGRYFGTMSQTLPPDGKADKLRYAPRFRKWRQVFGGAFELRPMIRKHLFRQDVVEA